jgi:homoserine O-acetyltransferase
MKRIIGCALALCVVGWALPASAYDGLVEKQVFTLPTYTTVGGQMIRDVRVGYEHYGSLSAARDNVILITHYFSGTSHAAGRYAEADPAPGYWDSIIGAGKPIDTDRFFVISSDTLVNLNAKDPHTVTTGPASINPDTGSPYGMTFPIVTIRDFVNVQKALLESLGIHKLYAVAGASMGAMQALEWAAAYPEMVERVIPVVGTAEVGAFDIGWANIWASAVVADPRWNNGDYYGREEPTAGLTVALKILTLQARHFGWAATTFGRKWAVPGRDPRQGWGNKFAIEQWLDRVTGARVKNADANSFLYLVRASQLFVVGQKATLKEGLKTVKARVLLIPIESDLLTFPEYSRQAMEILKKQGVEVTYHELRGDGGHVDGVLGIDQARDIIRDFLRR